MSQTTAVTTGSFKQEVLESPIPVLVDFWATWCGPCRAIAPHVDAVAEEFAGRAKVMKLNVDEEGEIAAQYGIQSIPTLLVFKGGKVVEQLIGARPKAEIAGVLSRHAG